MVARRSPSAAAVRQRLTPLVERAAASPGANRYRKRFGAVAHLWILLLHTLWASPSLRQTHAALRATPRWWQRWAMAAPISFSQLARSSSSHPSACLEALFEAVLADTRRQLQHDPETRLLQRLAALDSTFVRLSAKLCPWSVHGGFAPGIRLQSVLELGPEIPDLMRLSGAELNDRRALAERDLSAWAGWTLLFDLGYYAHRQLARLRAAQVHFITRLHPQAAYVVLAERAVSAVPTAAGDVVLRDCTIRLGSANNRAGAVLDEVRLIWSRNPAGVVQGFLTTRFDLEAAEVVALYRRRWRIELFFRWLKRQLGLVRPLGHSRAAVWATVLLVLSVTLLLVRILPEPPANVTRIAWLGQLQ